MKKLFMALIMVAAIFCPCNMALANYPAHLNGDSNYVLAYGHMGTAMYLDKSSIKVQSQSEDECILQVNIVYADSAIGDQKDFYNGGEGQVTDEKTKSYRYDRKNTKMYIYRADNNEWQLIDQNPSGASGFAMNAGELAYYITYGNKFYGNLTYGEKQWPVFRDSFYEVVNS